MLGALLAPAVAAAVEPPLWFLLERPTAQAWQAVDILTAAGDDGLDPQDYGAEALRRALVAAADGPILPAAEVDRVDDALTQAMERFFGDLHFGRVDPRDVHANFEPVPRGGFDPVAYVRAMVAAHRLDEAVREAAPRLPLYANVRDALARFRAIAADPARDGAWRDPLPPLPGRKLEPGQAYPGLTALAHRLTVLGDLPSGLPLPPRYEGALVEAVKAFQARHGLVQDGVIGKATLEQLAVSPKARVRQIELTLERLRWTPLWSAPRMVVVNVPEFMLRAYEVRDGRIDVAARMKVIVGKALDTRTPIFAEDMRFIEFSPYWNIPPSIARAETIPKLRRDPAYFDEQGLEFVDGAGHVTAAFVPGYLDAVLRGEMRIRQRPGPRNALGDIKFILPNDQNIYLHHTPTPQLFARGRRDFSHGCVRVEDPVTLAQFVLRDDPAWDETRIRAAMAAGASTTLRLQEPLPVVIAYSTVVVESDGRVHFFPDIYGHDELLDQAMRRPQQAVQWSGR